MSNPSELNSAIKAAWSSTAFAIVGGLSGLLAWLVSTNLDLDSGRVDPNEHIERSLSSFTGVRSSDVFRAARSYGLLAAVGVGAVCSVIVGGWMARWKTNRTGDEHFMSHMFSLPRHSPLPSALLPCITSHRRLLPTPAKHAFSYPLIYMGIDLDELESRNLDTSLRFFRYGTSKAILGFQHEHYLAPSTGEKTPVRGSWKQELKTLVATHGVAVEEMGRVWMVTMPSYLGFVGVNPLSVYFCYKDGDGQESAGLLCVVLEVHNTFEERHLYVLSTAHDEVAPQGNHDHAWIFPRTFHVSPFNNRAGFYRLDVQDPFAKSATVPRIKVTLNQLTQEKETKLYAALLNHPDKRKSPVPITIRNILTVVLWRQPWDLFLTTFRILRQAWTLHYRKRLLVYPRPELHTESTMESEPIGPIEELPGHTVKMPWNPVQVDVGGIGRSIGFRAVNAAEKKAERLLLPDLMRRVQEEGIAVEVKFADPSRKPIRIDPEGSRKPCLLIETRHPSLFIQLLMARTPRHFLLTADQEGHTQISSTEMFERLMTPRTLSKGKSGTVKAALNGWIESIRAAHLLFLLSFCDRPIPPDIVVVQQPHLADPSGMRQNLSLLVILASLLFADRIEEKVFRLVKAKFIPGQEPWTVWKRTVDSIWQDNSNNDDDGDKGLQGDRQYGSVLLSDVPSHAAHQE